MSTLKVIIFLYIYLIGLPAFENRYILEEVPKILIDFWKNDSYSFDNGEMSFPIDDTVWSENSDSEIAIPNHIIEKREFKNMDWNNELYVLRNTYFPKLPGYHKGGKSLKDEQYPWMTRIIQTSGLNGNPHMCTGVAIRKLVVVAAARCISGFTISFTKLVQYDGRANVLVMILPHNITKQGYDDIGFVIGDKRNNTISNIVPYIDGLLRTDNTYNWFRNSSLTDASKKYKALGFATEFDTYQQEGIHMYTFYGLVEIEVQISSDICHKIYAKGKLDGYKVPCYHTCSYEEHQAGADKCKGYLGVEGAAVYDEQNKSVIGIAMWGFESLEKNFPVGFSVLNSDPFIANYICGYHSSRVKIKNAQKFATHPSLCNDGCLPNNTMWYSNYFNTYNLDGVSSKPAVPRSDLET